MEDKYQKIFKNLSFIAPNRDLLASTLVRIQVEQRRLARRRFVLFVSTSVVSLSGLIASATFLIRSFIESGSYHYFSLFFSDLSYWKEITLFVAESLPAFGLALLLSASLVFLWSVGRAVKQVGIVFKVA